MKSLPCHPKSLPGFPKSLPGKMGLKMQASLWPTSSLARFLRNFSLFWWVTPKAWLAYSQCLGLFLLFLRIPEWTTTGWWRTTRRTRGSTPSSSSRSFPLIFPTSIQVRVMLFPYYLFGSVTSLPMTPYVRWPVLMSVGRSRCRTKHKIKVPLDKRILSL